jgi:MFS family permease
MIGIIMGIGSIGGTIGPTLAGAVFDTFGNYHFVWLGSFYLNVIAIILVLRIEPKTNSYGPVPRGPKRRRSIFQSL